MERAVAVLSSIYSRDTRGFSRSGIAGLLRALLSFCYRLCGASIRASKTPM